MIVQAPDNKTIDFGDMPPDQVQATMQKLYPPSAAILPDVAKSFGTGLGRGAIGMVTGPFDIGAKVGGYLANKVGQLAMGDNYTPGDAMPNVTEGIADNVGLDYKAKTLPGKYANTIGEFVPGVAALTEGNGAPLLQIAKKVAKTSTLAGAGSEALGQATEGTEAEPYARAAGGILSDNLSSVFGRSVKEGTSNALSGIVARNPEALQTTVDDMQSSVNAPYKKMRQLGDALKTEATNGLLESVDNKLNSLENKYIPELSPHTTAIVNALRKEADGGMLGVSDIDQYQRKLSRVSGINPEDQFSAGLARKAIQDHLDSLTGNDLVNGSTESLDLLKQGRDAAATRFRTEDVADLLSKANGDPNRIKAALQKFVSNDDNLKGFNDTEKAALRNAANYTTGENLLKGIGKLGLDFSKSGTGNTVMPFLLSFAKAGGASFVPGGIPLVAGATAARQVQKYITRGKAEKALKLIENRGNMPQASQVPQPSMNFGLDRLFGGK